MWGRIGYFCGRDRGEYMKITNKHNLPTPLYNAICFDDYSMGDADISVTGLISPPRIRQLKMRHANEIVEDVTDRIWMFFGTMIHNILENTNTPDVIKEQHMNILVKGWKISGTLDLFENGILSDYKITSVWSAIYGVKPEWEKQLNLYKVMLGYTVDKLQIVAILRDWTKSKVGGNYPTSQVAVLPVKMMDEAHLLTWAHWRVDFHRGAESMSDEDLPFCTDEEKWKKEDTWAVTKKGNKRAKRVLDSEEDAEKYIEDNKLEKHIIEHRVGKATRCEGYCSVNRWCNDYKGG